MRRPAKARAACPPIIDAKTIMEFIKAVNCEYRLNIPERWQDGSMLAQIWALEVSVSEGPDPGSFTATAKDLFPAIGLPAANFAGRFDATVTRGTEFYLRNSVGGERLTLDDLNQLEKEI
jgi:hypothetical protein